MPRESDDNSKPLMFIQTLIDERIGSIEARVIHEKSLESDHLQWLLGPDPNSPRSVGISPAYSQSGGLPAIACAYDTRVLVINFHSTKTYRDDGATSGAIRPRNVERRKMLEEELLCHPLRTLFAFDIAPLALSLYHNHYLRLTDAIDIQSALRIPDRSIVTTLTAVISDAFPIFSENIVQAFEDVIYKSNKHKDLTALVQRAWLSSYVGRYDYGGIQDLFYKSPKVDMKAFSEDELDFLKKLAHDMLRQDNMKPGSVTHEINTHWDPKKNRMVATSQRYSNRVHNSSRTKVELAQGFSLLGGTSNFRGKSGLIEVALDLEGKDVMTLTSFGKDTPTRAEQDRSGAILSMLQGNLPLLDNHWMRALWLPSQPVNWPESFNPPSDSPTVEIKEHPDAPLNDSQQSAITNMLSSCPITLVQGPPGTGKTTVIATYVLSAIEAGQRGIWLMAQSNVAVKNIAEKLAKIGFFDFKLLVSRDFHYEWHEHLYEKVEKNIILSHKLPKRGGLMKALQGAQVILCTLSMISNPKLQEFGLTQYVPVMHVIIDEASQIEIGQYLPLFKSFGATLRKLCFIGDDKQRKSLLQFLSIRRSTLRSTAPWPRRSWRFAIDFRTPSFERCTVPDRHAECATR
ncbi:P-loop containing nucleoside triphosphate hydrolase protein [Russula earlei]|uniref:P-loop containing nucleoside triphosphate hydrolase protein n=1 Tax=Russula earlei TaxID=71964 RepID=A0ACC0UKH5_9AGAM|nr:P-loop containing nucleoside triphosphate hydrolase protein [Russula earlei]